MAKYTREEILEIVQDEDVEFIRLQFVDIYGIIKHGCTCMSVTAYP